MKRLFYLFFVLVLFGLLSGCATMSKKECANANWHTIGYSDGAKGVHHQYLEKRRKSCGKHEIIPDDAAYHAGWGQGIRSYCTSDNGYRAGKDGKAYPNICPQDVETNFLSGWKQGIRQFCTPENGLQQGLSGYQYRGVCPVGMEATFHDYYRLGHDVREARDDHRSAERAVEKAEKALASEKDAHKHRELLYQLERLQHEEERGEATLISLEACMSHDGFDAGYRDGEAGHSDRAREIGNVCRSYGIRVDRVGYREGWYQGVDHYCTYNSGLYVGQTNQHYSGVCSGRGHRQFWRGYEDGRHLYQKGRYEGHPKPEKQRAVQHLHRNTDDKHEEEHH